MTVFEWEPFLRRWSHEWLQDPENRAQLPADVRDSNWLGYPGATEAQLAALEEHLGAALPPSFRAFLSVTNGWRYTTSFIDQLWSTDDIEWFTVRNQDWVDAYTEPAEDLPPLTDEQYLVYGDEQSTTDFRTEYLQTALEISANGDSAICLLNPEIVTPEGEWEAWFFVNWYPGADRYRSFQELMQAAYAIFLHDRTT